MTTVSFIVTVYNKRAFLPRVLDALAAQRGEFAREYVFVDDGSTDDSLAYIKSATSGWRDCKILSQPNRGASAAMNAAVDAATGDYLKLVDADDLLVPDATRWLLEALERPGVVLAYGDEAPYDPARPVEWPASPSVPELEPIAAPLRLMMRSSTLNPSKMLLARADYLRVGGTDETVCCQDYSLALPLAHLGSFVHIRAVVMLAPSVAPGRLSENTGKVLHDVTRVLGTFVARHEHLARADQRYAVKRAATRAMLWCQRHGDFSDAARFWRLSMAARLGLVRDPERAILDCCSAYLAPPQTSAAADGRPK